MECVIKLIWNEKDKFWHSESMNDQFGLTLESGSLDALIERIKIAIPEVFELIGFIGEVNLSFEIERTEKIVLAAS